VFLGEGGRPDPSGQPYTLVVDWKTSKSVYPSVALQMAAYAGAETILSPDGTSAPMPHVDGAAVLHIGPDGWSLKPVHIGPEVFATFLHLREVFAWETRLSREVIGLPIAKSAHGRLVTGTQRRAA
jgi:hypothetical protein